MHHGMGGMKCPACGFGTGHHMGKGMKALFMIMPWKIMMHSDEIGLSDEQLEALRNRHCEARKQMIRISSQIKMDMVDVQNAVMREEIDMPTAEAKIKEIGKLKGDMFMTILQAMQDMRNTLSPDQRKKVKEMVMSWFKKGGMPYVEMEEGQEEESGEMPE